MLTKNTDFSIRNFSFGNYDLVLRHMPQKHARNITLGTSLEVSTNAGMAPNIPTWYTHERIEQKTKTSHILFHILLKIRASRNTRTQERSIEILFKARKGTSIS
jgi:hypothetical protein